MKKIVSGILLTLISSLIFAQSNTIAWQTKPIKIDGRTKDWGGRPAFYDSKTKLAFDIRNDSANLYLVLQVPDPMTQVKIARAGMSIDFATKTKPKCKAYITLYPFMKGNPDQQDHNKGMKPEKMDIKQKYLINPMDVQGSGFAFTNGSFTSVSADNVIVYAVGWDTLNTMSVEFRIPLRELFGEHYDLKQIAQKDIALKLQENPLDMPPSGGRETEGGSGMGHGGGMESGGGMNGGGVGTGGGSFHRGSADEMQTGEQHDRSTMFETLTLHQSFKLNCNGK